MAFQEFVIGLFVLIVLIILINFGIFVYKLCVYGKKEHMCFWPTIERNSVPLTEVNIPCTISAQVSATEGLGPNRRLSELLIQDGELVLINYSTANGKVLLNNMASDSNSRSCSTYYYEDLPPSYDSCVLPSRHVP